MKLLNTVDVSEVLGKRVLDPQCYVYGKVTKLHFYESKPYIDIMWDNGNKTQQTPHLDAFFYIED